MHWLQLVSLANSQPSSWMASSAELATVQKVRNSSRTRRWRTGAHQRSTARSSRSCEWQRTRAPNTQSRWAQAGVLSFNDLLRGGNRVKAIFHEKIPNSICFVFQEHKCENGASCSRHHRCIGCGEPKPYNDWHCLQPKIHALPSGSACGLSSQHDFSASVSSLQCSPCVKIGSARHRHFFVSSNSCHESDLLAALLLATAQQPELHFEFWFFDLELTIDFLEVRTTLDRLRSRFFRCGAPGTLGPWSRVPHCSSPGQHPSNLGENLSWTFRAASVSKREECKIQHRCGGVLLVHGTQPHVPFQ